MTFYRIRDWQRHFENNRTRELKRMDWVPIPNKHDGSGFTQLLNHANGMAHLGAWVLMVQIASRCDPRGTLSQEGAGGVKTPLTPHLLAVMSHGSAAVFDEAIPRLLSIGWLETYVNTAPSCGARTAGRCGKVPMEWNGMEWKGMEEGVPPLEAKERGVGETVSPIPEFKEGLAIEELFSALGNLFHRPHGRPVSYEEEHLMAEITRRPEWKAELKEVQDFHSRLGARERCYFPQSLTRTLRDWQQTLDRARVYEPNPNFRTAVEKEADALIRKLEREIKEGT